jgi:hypothetical protein
MLSLKYLWRARPGDWYDISFPTNDERQTTNDVDASLIVGHWSLVVGHWSLVIGHWSLVIGRWSLVVV